MGTLGTCNRGSLGAQEEVWGLWDSFRDTGDVSQGEFGDIAASLGTLGTCHKVGLGKQRHVWGHRGSFRDTVNPSQGGFRNTGTALGTLGTCQRVVLGTLGQGLGHVAGQVWWHWDKFGTFEEVQGH